MLWQEAIEYGLIDQVLTSTRDLPVGMIPTNPMIKAMMGDDE